MLYNHHRNFDKGMDDAYMGYEPQMTRNDQYMIGYEYAQELLNYEPDDEVIDTMVDEHPPVKAV